MATPFKIFSGKTLWKVVCWGKAHQIEEGSMVSKWNLKFHKRGQKRVWVGISYSKRNLETESIVAVALILFQINLRFGISH